jgi:ATP-dependent exoDNAse (exonuclease V) alpha subunit
MLLRNISVQHGLVNGALGIVRAICYSRNGAQPLLPDCVFVEFDGYSGPSLAGSGGEQLVPILPMPDLDGRQGTQLPLRLAWAITVHKSQGLTLPEAFVGFPKGKSPVPGLVYTALTRVKRLQDLHVSDCSLQRLKQVTQCSSVKEAEMRRLLELSRQVE